MATLLVRKLEPELVELLKRQAASHGRSVEAEHRAIMRTALQPLQPKLDGKELFEMLREGETWPGTSSPTADGVMIAVSRPTFEPCLASFSTPMWATSPSTPCPILMWSRGMRARRSGDLPRLRSRNAQHQ